LEQNQSVGKIMVDDPAVLPQVSTVDEDLLHAVVDVRDRVSWPLGSCSESASGGSYVWWGNYAVDLVVSGLIGLGLPLNHFQHSQSLQSRVEAGNFKSQPFGCWYLVVFQDDGDQPIEVAESGEDLCDMAKMEGEASMGRVPPLNTYSPISGGLSGYFDWVIQCANEIYPIVGISYVGHKQQLLALLTFLEEERRNEEVGALLSGGAKGKREVKNLESSVNYDARGSCSIRGKRWGVIQLCHEA